MVHKVSLMDRVKYPLYKKPKGRQRAHGQFNRHMNTQPSPCTWIMKASVLPSAQCPFPLEVPNQTSSAYTFLNG